jgi:hypothetical protein
MKMPDFSHLEQAVICGLLLGGEEESRAIRELRINISVKGQVDYVVLTEWKAFEIGLRRIVTEKDGVRLRQVCCDCFDFMPALWQSNQFLSFRSGNCS